jgi:hypothetical protein
VVGKTRTNQFASGDQPTADWVDYQCPYNSRKYVSSATPFFQIWHDPGVAEC